MDLVLFMDTVQFGSEETGFKIESKILATVSESRGIQDVEGD